MARTVDPVRHGERRDAILDVATALLVRRGFDTMTVADVMAATGISKGAFYHYFSGKDEVLAAVITRQIDRWSEAIETELSGSTDPIERLRRMVQTLALAKTDDLSLLIKAVPQLYSDRNAAMQVRIRRAGVERFLPTITEIVEDGVLAGSFRAPDPAAAARVVLSLLQEASDTSARYLQSIMEGSGDGAGFATHVHTYGNAIRAVLGVPAGPENFLDIPELDAWAQAALALRTTEGPISGSSPAR